jgi:uncharacterized protein (DUF58 family)
MSELLFLVLFLLVLALLLRVDFVFYVAYVTLGIYLLSRWYTPRLMGRLAVRRVFEDHAFLGQNVTIEVQLTNPSRLPIPWLHIVESVPPELRISRAVRQVITLPGRTTHRAAYDVRAMRRGYYRLGPALLNSGDLFGFNQSQKRLREAFLTVYPRIIPLAHHAMASHLPFGTIASRQRLFEDPARPTGVRAYRIGDPLKHMNWKVSAHADGLLVKTFEPAVSLESMILLNLNRAEYPFRQRFDLPEWAIVVAASIAAYLVELRQAVGLSTNGADPLRAERADGDADAGFDQESGRLVMRQQTGDRLAEDVEQRREASLMPGIIVPRNGRGHLMKILASLARIEPGETVPFALHAPRSALNLSWGVSVIAITPRGDRATCRALHGLVRAGFNAVLIVVDPYANFARTLSLAQILGVSAFHVGGPEDLSKWQRTWPGRRRQVARRM